MSICKLLLVTCSIFLITSCAKTTRYTWNEYDNKLYQHYKNPAENDQFIDHLKQVIERGEDSQKVPPGIYAEYGYALYEKGSLQEAEKYFKLENDKWPESRVLMAKMILNAQTRGKQAKKPDQGVPVNSVSVSSTAAETKEDK